MNHEAQQIPAVHNTAAASSTSSDAARLARTASFSCLNAAAPAFVPRAAATSAAAAVSQPRLMHVYHHGPPPQMIHPFRPPPFFAPVSNQGEFKYFGGGDGVFGEREAVQALVDRDPALAVPVVVGLLEEVVQKITKQVEYYFSDLNLATTEHLMRFISKDPEGFVPLSVIASFKKIKALVQDDSFLADVLRASPKLVVSDDGKKVRREMSITKSDVEKLQSRILVAENLPEDHSYQKLMKIFSSVGSVKTIRTCYPQPINGTISATNRSSKFEVLFSNKLHAFVEYETNADAERAVAELSDGKNRKSGIRARLLLKCLANLGISRARKMGHGGDGVGGGEDLTAAKQPNDKELDNSSQIFYSLIDHVDNNFNDKESRLGHGKGRGSGTPGRGRHQYHNYNHVGAPPSSLLF